MWIDRLSTPLDDLWSKTDFRDVGPNGITSTNDFLHEVKTEWPHFCPSSPPEDNDTDVEIDVETVGVPVTLTPDVSLNSTSSTEELNLASAVPSSVLITAEVIDGEYLGNITDLEVSIPSDLDTLLSGDPGVILGENLEVDLVTDSSSAVTDGGSSSSNSASKGGVGTNSGSSGGVTFHDLSNSEWASSFSSSTSERQQQHSVNFTTQPTSKFVTLDSTNTLPLAVSGLQLSTSNMTGDEIQSCSLPSSSLTAVASSSSSSTSSSQPPSSSMSSSSSSSISLSTSSATSLSNSFLCASSSIVNDKVGSECSTNSECSDSQALTSSSSSSSSSHLQQQQESSSADALSVCSGILLSNNKNNGSNVLSSATTNNLVSHKLYASTTRTNDSLPNSDSSSTTVLTNGPSNSLDSSKCAKVDHYMFHET